MIPIHSAAWYGQLSSPSQASGLWEFFIKGSVQQEENPIRNFIAIGGIFNFGMWINTVQIARLECVLICVTYFAFCAP